jgi:hypothetical protein
MLVWFNKGNQKYLQAVHNLECMKFELSKLNTELTKMEKILERSKNNIDSYLKNLDFLKKYTKIISMIEFQKVRYLLAGEYQTMTSVKRSIVEWMGKIKNLEVKISSAEEELPLILNKKNNVLEFKKRG